MKLAQSLIVVALAGALAACGSGGSGTSPASSAAANQAAAASLPASASAEEVAAHMRGNISCPASVKTPAPAAGAPVDDFRGVRPGQTYDEAANVVMCTNPLMVVTPATDRGYQIQTFGQKLRQGFTARLAEPRIEKSGRQIMQEMEREQQARMSNAVQHDLEPGQEKWFVSTMGMPGQERVIGAAHEEMFAKNKNPTVDSIIQTLIKKYGQPTQKQDQKSSSGQRHYHSLRWAWDPRGRLITETSPLFGCDGVADPNDGINLSANCGIVVKAVVITENDNIALVQTLQVGVVDQAAGYALLTATEQGLKSMDAARRAKEVQQAAKNAPAVSM